MPSLLPVQLGWLGSWPCCADLDKSCCGTMSIAHFHTAQDGIPTLGSQKQASPGAGLLSLRIESLPSGIIQSVCPPPSTQGIWRTVLLHSQHTVYTAVIANTICTHGPHTPFLKKIAHQNWGACLKLPAPPVHFFPHPLLPHRNNTRSRFSFPRSLVCFLR